MDGHELIVTLSFGGAIPITVDFFKKGIVFSYSNVLYEPILCLVIRLTLDQAGALPTPQR
jgi:hypothetical protein